MLLNHYLKKLKLPTMLREYAAVASSCAQDDRFAPQFGVVELLDRGVEGVHVHMNDLTSLGHVCHSTTPIARTASRIVSTKKRLRSGSSAAVGLSLQ